MSITLPADIAAQLGEPVEPPPEETSVEETPAVTTPAASAPADPAPASEPAPRTPPPTTARASGGDGGRVGTDVLDAVTAQRSPAPSASRPIADNLEFLRSMNIDTSLPSPPRTLAGSEIQHPTYFTRGRAPGRQEVGTAAMTDPQLRGSADYRDEIFTPMRKSLAAQQAEMRQLHQVATALQREIEATQTRRSRAGEFSTAGRQATDPATQIEQARTVLEQIDTRRRQLAPELRTAVNDFRNMANAVGQIRDLYPPAAVSPTRQQEIQNILREEYGIEDAANAQDAVTKYIEAQQRITPITATPVGRVPEAIQRIGNPSQIGIDTDGARYFNIGNKWYWLKNGEVVNSESSNQFNAMMKVFASADGNILDLEAGR